MRIQEKLQNSALVLLSVLDETERNKCLVLFLKLMASLNVSLRINAVYFKILQLSNIAIINNMVYLLKSDCGTTAHGHFYKVSLLIPMKTSK